MEIIIGIIGLYIGGTVGAVTMAVLSSHNYWDRYMDPLYIGTKVRISSSHSAYFGIWGTITKIQSKWYQVKFDSPYYGNVSAEFRRDDLLVNINVINILTEWLQNNGYEGLYRPGECSCRTGMLFEYCGVVGGTECMPGYIVPCNDYCEYCDSLHIGPNKPEVQI